MFDYSKLRRLAHEASETEMDWLDRDWLSGIMADDWADYVAAIEPQVVIDLIDENERVDGCCKAMAVDMGKLTRERNTFSSRAEKLKAENEALLEGMARIMRATRLHDPAFAIACEVVGELSAVDNQDLDDVFSPGSGSKARRRAESLGIDYAAATGKGAQA